MIYNSWRTRTRRPGTGLRPARTPDHSAVIAARLRAEQDDVIARWATDLPRRQRRWLR